MDIVGLHDADAARFRGSKTFPNYALMKIAAGLDTVYPLLLRPEKSACPHQPRVHVAGPARRKAVPPPFATALVRANWPERCIKTYATMAELEGVWAV